MDGSPPRAGLGTDRNPVQAKGLLCRKGPAELSWTLANFHGLILLPYLAWHAFRKDGSAAA